MHVLYVIDSLDRPGGAEQGLAAVAPGLVARGLRLDVAYLLDREGFQDDLRRAGVGVHPVIGGSRIANVRALTRLLRLLSPDLVHTTLYESDIAGRTAAAAVRVPVVSSLVNASYGPEHLRAPGLHAWKVRAAQAADMATARVVRRFHAISGYVADTMARRLLVPRDRIEVIPRGRDPVRLGCRSASRRRSVRQALDIDDSAMVLLAAARHEYQKGLDVLVTAMGEISRSRGDAVLLVAGRFGDESDRLRVAAQEAGVTGRVRLLGPRDDVPDLMAAADLFVAPSRWEGLGSAALEAMGVGVPLVVSDVPAMRELVGSEANAALVPPGDSAALAHAVVAAVDDPEATTARAVAARQRFCDQFALPRTLARTWDFYCRSLDA